MLQNHAHGTFTDFRGVGRSLSHGLIFSRVEASTKPGAIQVSFIYTKLVKKFGRVADRDNSSLTKSIEYVVVIIDELRRMLK
jgi:hypothetical protein